MVSVACPRSAQKRLQEIILTGFGNFRCLVEFRLVLRFFAIESCGEPVKSKPRRQKSRLIANIHFSRAPGGSAQCLKCAAPVGTVGGIVGAQNQRYSRSCAFALQCRAIQAACLSLHRSRGRAKLPDRCRRGAILADLACAANPDSALISILWDAHLHQVNSKTRVL